MRSSQVKLFAAAVSLLFGLGIISVSLFSASQPFATDLPSATRTSFYFGSRMLPDHVLYPIVMVFDRLYLLSLPKNERSSVEVQYAFDRMHSAEALLDGKNNPELALATLKKSQRYLLLAGNKTLENPKSNTVACEYIRWAMRAHIKDTSRLIEKFPAQYQSAASELLNESRVMYKQLTDSSKTLSALN
ncbi:MAG: hypothetical protein COY80_05080 [Candidatus Pacebacteria bacterium CG_4_10_14_0_8_um_filter_42_14]|nr:MAG: hypothetical protein COY80_05080 [Candidatus Pacebacteria bacterium CG_4_10_14_0_8_um_filter_42_14]